MKIRLIFNVLLHGYGLVKASALITALKGDCVGILPMNFNLNAWQLKRREIATEQSLLNQDKRRPWLRWMVESLVRVVLPESEAY